MKKTCWYPLGLLGRPWIVGAAMAAMSLAAAVHPDAAAQDKSAPSPSSTTVQSLPAGESLLDAYAEAIGGKAVLEKFSSRKSEGTFEIKSLGVKGAVEIVQAMPNKMLVSVDLPGIGKIDNGCDGETVWENSVLSGQRVLEGEERNQFLRRAYFQSELEWRKIYETAKTVGVDRIDDRPVWVVEIKPIGSDKIQTTYFDQETGLMRRLKLTITSPMGDLAVENEFLDYREVDGVKMPFESVQSVLGQTQTIRLTKVTHDAQIDDRVFELPKK